MSTTDKTEIITSVSTPAAPKPVAITGPTSVVPIELLRKYASPKPVRRPSRGELPPSALKDLAEVYTAERKAEFLLGSCLDAEEYAQAVEEVRAMGLDPEKIPHCKPPGV
jgi:hypothetical protein